MIDARLAEGEVIIAEQVDGVVRIVGRAFLQVVAPQPVRLCLRISRDPIEAARTDVRDDQLAAAEVRAFEIQVGDTFQLQGRAGGEQGKTVADHRPAAREIEFAEAVEVPVETRQRVREAGSILAAAAQSRQAEGRIERTQHPQLTGWG